MNLEKKIAIIGLGYVGLPLAVAFGKTRTTIGYDINEERVNQLSHGNDVTLECTEEELRSAGSLSFTTNPEHIKECSIYIITVPTPIDSHKKPDLTPLIKASTLIGQVVSHGDIVIYESTVYPGATEEDCVPVIESVSGLRFNKEFFVGYSPERINPGDKINRLETIKKVTSGSTPDIATEVDQLYGSIIVAGTHKASSIKVAEASKIIENTQRDVNIALMNEFKILFDKLDIDTQEVINAASTKWNFISLRPGLVGGHCIGVDPYYLVHKAQEVGFIPDIMKSAREINDGMPSYLAHRFVKKMINSDIKVKGSNLLVLGFTFKADCSDIRNTKVYELISELESYDINVDVVDPRASVIEVNEVYSLAISNSLDLSKSYDAVCLAVNHTDFSSEIFSSLIENTRVVFRI